MRAGTEVRRARATPAVRAGIAAAAMALASAACQGPYLTEAAYYEDPPPEPLSGEAIQRLLVGNSVVSDASDGPYVIFFPDAGQVLGRHSRNYHDRGQWRVTDAGICARWDNWWSNVERCWQVMSAGTDLTWLDPHGDSAEADARIVAGNPAGLE